MPCGFLCPIQCLHRLSRWLIWTDGTVVSLFELPFGVFRHNFWGFVLISGLSQFLRGGHVFKRHCLYFVRGGVLFFDVIEFGLYGLSEWDVRDHERRSLFGDGLP